jgi:hypothetical protein
MSTRTNKRYKIIYDKINAHYNGQEFLSIPKACEKEGIATSTYYKICKTLNKRTIAEKGRMEDERKERRKMLAAKPSKTPLRSKQKGGYESIHNTEGFENPQSLSESFDKDEVFSIGGKPIKTEYLKTESLPILPQMNDQVKIRRDKVIKSENANILH